MDWANTIARRDEKHLRFGTCLVLFYGNLGRTKGSFHRCIDSNLNTWHMPMTCLCWSVYLSTLQWSHVDVIMSQIIIIIVVVVSIIITIDVMVIIESPVILDTTHSCDITLMFLRPYNFTLNQVARREKPGHWGGPLRSCQTADSMAQQPSIIRLIVQGNFGILSKINYAKVCLQPWRKIF